MGLNMHKHDGHRYEIRSAFFMRRHVMCVFCCWTLLPLGHCGILEYVHIFGLIFLYGPAECEMNSHDNPLETSAESESIRIRTKQETARPTTTHSNWMAVALINVLVCASHCIFAIIMQSPKSLNTAVPSTRFLCSCNMCACNMTVDFTSNILRTVISVIVAANMLSDEIGAVRGLGLRSVALRRPSPVGTAVCLVLAIIARRSTTPTAVNPKWRRRRRCGWLSMMLLRSLFVEAQ